MLCGDERPLNSSKSWGKQRRLTVPSGCLEALYDRSWLPQVYDIPDAKKLLAKEHDMVLDEGAQVKSERDESKLANSYI